MSQIIITRKNRLDSFKKVFIDPWEKFDQLDIVVGYGSYQMLRILLKEIEGTALSKIKIINLFLGMNIFEMNRGKNAATIYDRYCEVIDDYSNYAYINIFCNYMPSFIENHSKNYFYSKNGFYPELLFTGSANFSKRVWDINSTVDQINDLTIITNSNMIKQRYNTLKRSNYYNLLAGYIYFNDFAEINLMPANITPISKSIHYSVNDNVNIEKLKS